MAPPKSPPNSAPDALLVPKDASWLNDADELKPTVPAGGD